MIVGQIPCPLVDDGFVDVLSYDPVLRRADDLLKIGIRTITESTIPLRFMIL
ncbi:MAG: hypothetical protein GX825_00525 [Syntrophomonadaceae bacterium]|nr:hypothetical protein [Syntrophomonadaceae bacterium]